MAASAGLRPGETETPIAAGLNPGETEEPLPGTAAPSAKPATPGSPLKTIAQHTAVQAAGTGPVMAAAGMGAALGLASPIPGGAALGGVLGAGIGGLAIPAFEYAASRLVGLDKPVPTYADARHAAFTSMLGQAVGDVAGEAQDKLYSAVNSVAEHILGIPGATKAGETAAAGAVAAGEDLAKQQADIRGEMAAKRAEAGRGAFKEHADKVLDAENKVATSRAKLKENISKDVERARPAAAEQVAQKQTEKLVGKTQQEFQREAAQPYEQRAAALSKASDPYFDASAKFHEEVGAKFEPYIGKIKNDPVAPNTMTSIQSRLGGIEQTLGERGQRIESPELRKIMADLNPVTENMPPVGGVPFAQFEKLQPDAAKQIRERMGGGDAQLTFGQLWGERARANRVLASARNPADRWAAREVINEINDAIPGVPPEIRSQYAFERKVNQSVIRKVAGARNPQEVGEALFGSKNAPEPAEVPLQIIRFTKQYNPQGMDGIREAFADRWLGNKMDANDLGKLNPQVLKELYGDSSDDVIRLLGPEGNVKQASWEQLIKSDPAARQQLLSAARASAVKQQNIALQEAIVEGKAALRELGPKYDYVRAKVDAVKTPAEKLKVLAKEMPDPEQARVAGFRAQAYKVGHMEGYLKRRLMFMAMFTALGGYGAITKRPGMIVAAGILGAGLGARGLARTALSSEMGATTYMKLLNMRPTAANAASMGQGLAALSAAAITDHISDNSGALH